MRILITGVTGFAGAHLAAHCAEAGDAVVGLTRPGSGAPAPPGITTVEAEIDDRDAVARALDEAAPDAIVHLAGASSVGRSFGDPGGTWRVNLGGTLALLEALRASGRPPRTLVVTSGEIYGRVDAADLPVRPETPLRPLSPYGASKAAADLAAGQYRDAHGLDVIRVRAFNHIGPGQDPRFVLPNVARQIARAERDGQDPVEVVVGNVDTRRDFTDVRDVVRAYRLLIERGDPDRVYQVCSGGSRPVRELVEGLEPLARVRASVRSDASLRREGEQPDLYGSADLIRADTGWRPRIDLEDTLADTLDYWRDRVAEETTD